MLQFWIALIVFLGSHSVISRTRLRPLLISRFGKTQYILLYSLLSILLLFWVFAAALDAPRIILWPFLHSYYWLPNILMPLACVLFVGGIIRPNPLSIMGRSSGFDPDHPPFIVAVTRHPVLWGFFLWSFSHILPNGEFPLGFLFAIFALFALIGTRLVDRKFRRDMGAEEWSKLSANTGNIPFTAKSLWGGRFSFNRYDVFAIIAGLALYAGLYALHPVFFHIMPIPPM